MSIRTELQQQSLNGIIVMLDGLSAASLVTAAAAAGQTHPMSHTYDEQQA
jgi:hypothetical protein